MKKRGRPTKYKEKYVQEMIDFFQIEPYREVEEEIVDKKGNVHYVTKRVANDFPTFERFAVKIGVHTDTLQEWRKVHPIFSVAYKKAKDYQKNFLIQNGLNGLFAPAFTIFTAKNVTNMKDRIIQDTNVSFNKGDMLDLEKDIDELRNSLHKGGKTKKDD